MALILLPDGLHAIVPWLNSLSQVTDLVADRIGTRLPAEDRWPAVRLDPIPGSTIVEFRIDQPRYQVQSFATTDEQAILVARTVRAGLVAMAGYRRPGELVVVDVTTSTPYLVDDLLTGGEPNRTPPISHASFSTAVTVRPDP